MGENFELQEKRMTKEEYKTELFNTINTIDETYKLRWIYVFIEKQIRG